MSILHGLNHGPVEYKRGQGKSVSSTVNDSRARTCKGESFTTICPFRDNCNKYSRYLSTGKVELIAPFTDAGCNYKE